MPLTSQTSGFKAGDVKPWPATSAPAGWLKANGAAVSRASYAALFAVIGTTFGVGDGSTTFNLPDLRGEFIRGLDDGRGVDTGRAIGTFQAEDIKSHTHTIPAKGSSLAAYGFNESLGGNDAATGTITSNSSGGTETRPRNIAMLNCIKY